MAMCVLPDPLDRLRDASRDLIDEDNCDAFGSGVILRSKQHLQAYPTKNVMFYIQIPSKLSRYVMSKWFQFLITDLGMQFTSGEYAEKVTRMLLIINVGSRLAHRMLCHQNLMPTSFALRLLWGTETTTQAHGIILQGEMFLEPYPVDRMHG